MLKFILKFEKEILWFILGLYATGVLLAFSTEQNSSLIETLNNLGAFLSGGGAFAAIFTLVHVIYSKQQERIESEVAEVIYSGLIINRQLQFLLGLAKTTKLLEVKDITSYAYQMESFDFNKHLENQIRLDKLLFLLGSSDAGLIEIIDGGQRNFSTLSNKWDQRNQLWFDYHQRVTSGEFHGQKFINRSNVAKVLGESHLLELERCTKDIQHYLKVTIEWLEKADKDLKLVLKNDYKGSLPRRNAA